MDVYPTYPGFQLYAYNYGGLSCLPRFSTSQIQLLLTILLTQLIHLPDTVKADYPTYPGFPPSGYSYG